MFNALPNKVRESFRAHGKKERKSTENIVAGVRWRMECYDEADANNDGCLD